MEQGHEEGAGRGVGARGTEPESAVKRDAVLTRRTVLLTLLLLAALASLSLYLKHRRELLRGLKAGAEKAREVLTGQPATPPDPYAEAVTAVEADRGEAAGRAARAEVPAELRQYREPRRFLAVQSAAAAEAGVKPPHDFAELAAMIKAGRDLVEAPRLGRGYVLYGVGLTATGELTHYDARARKNVPLFADAAEANSFADGLAADRTRLEAELKELDGRLKGLGRADRAERARLLSGAAAKRRELAGIKEREEVVADYYGKAAGQQGRARLFAEYEVLAGLARDFGGRSYDLRDRASAREFQARLLSFLRPPALAVLEELGTAYQTKFDRPLPVTSLVRTEEYQRLLR